MQASRVGKLLTIGVVFTVVVATLCPTLAGQEQDSEGAGLAVGVSFESLWFSGGEALGMLGASLSFELTESLSFAIHYSRKAVDFLGVEIASVSALDVVTSYDFTPSERAGLYIFGGGGYLQGELLGISVGDIFIGGGLGLRLSIGTSGAITIQYRLRAIEFGEELMHAAEGGFWLAF